jgi:DNA-binding transcriptional MerR regulator
MSLKDVARVLNIKPYRIEYLLANGIVPEPQLRVAGRRLFTPDDVRRLAKHFGVKLPETEVAAATAVEPAAEVAGV